MDRDRDYPQKNVVPTKILECPRCGENACGRFGGITSPWFYCYSCSVSGTKGWVFNSNSKGMLTQLDIRKYLQSAKSEYMREGFPDPGGRMRYGVPCMKWDVSNTKLFDRVLFLGSRGDFVDLSHKHGGFFKTSSGIRKSDKHPFVVLEQYPGLVCGVCFLTADGPICSYITSATKRKVRPVAILRMPRTFEEVVYVPEGVERALVLAREHCVFALDTCVVAKVPNISLWQRK